MPHESNHYRRAHGGEAAGAEIWRGRHADLFCQWPQGARHYHLRRVQGSAWPAIIDLILRRRRRIESRVASSRSQGNTQLKITRLRLLGFKSFVEPTEILIEPGLTGVVGPNGCGKSNLLEALRWAMGETS